MSIRVESRIQLRIGGLDSQKIAVCASLTPSVVSLSYRKWLNPGEAPNVKFLLSEEKPVAVYAYCNLHGLWKTELN